MIGQHPPPRPRRRRPAGRGRSGDRDAPAADRRSQPVGTPAAVQRGPVGGGGLQRRDLQPPRHLRSRLGVSEHVFRGTSDTEVLVHGYEQLGASELVRRLGGMFAFALYDRRRRKLFLARDGFGIKPLYLRRTGRQLSFASEIRALAFDGEGAALRSIRPSPAPTCASVTFRRRGRRSPGSPRSRPGRCTRSISPPARRGWRPSTGWRPPHRRHAARRAARTAARAAQRLGAAAPHGRRADRAVSLGRARLQRARRLRQPSRRAAQDVFDRLFVLRSR